MIQETAARVQGNGFAAPLIISNQEHRFLIAEQLRAAGIEGARIILEPVGRNTAPAAAVAALQVAAEDPDGLLLLLPSDHNRGRTTQAFHDAIAIAAKAARTGALVTFGIKPDSPQTGYGYIKSAAPQAGVPGAYAIDRFVEKPGPCHRPGLCRVRRILLERGGMFLFQAKSFLAELQRLQPQMLGSCRGRSCACSIATWISSDLGEPAFLACSADSIDYAVMERAVNAAVVPVERGWNDVGSWQSLWDISVRSVSAMPSWVTFLSINARFLYPQRGSAGGRGRDERSGGGCHQGCRAGQPS